MAVGDGSPEHEEDQEQELSFAAPAPIDDTARPLTPDIIVQHRDDPFRDDPIQNSSPVIPSTVVLNDSYNNGEDEGGSEEEEDNEDDDEPRLKYAPLTRNLGGVYRNGDSTSTFLVAGDKLILGTHNGVIHVYNMPLLQIVRTYKAHQASVSSISISPYPPPLPIAIRPDARERLAAESVDSPQNSPGKSPNVRNSPRPPPVPKNPSNEIYIATSSIEGHVCVQNLIDAQDVQLRNFGRPVQTVALSPDYRNDRTYLSGGQAGQLISTVGGQAGKSANATTTGVAASASGWLGAIGLGSNTGTDTVRHSGEGVIHAIKYSLSGRYIIWVNEFGIKFMRSHLKMEYHEGGLEWKRISHTDPPKEPGWDEIAAVQRARVEWIDRTSLNTDQEATYTGSAKNGMNEPGKPGSEEVIVGWGDSAWIFRVTPSAGADSMARATNSLAGTVVLIRRLKLGDCTVSGVAMYTPSLMLVLAHMQKKKKKSSKEESKNTPRGRFHHRTNALKPELRLIDVTSKEEVEVDVLEVSRYESLSSSDYHLGVLYPMKIPANLNQKGYLGQIGSGIGTGVNAIGSGVAVVGGALVSGTEVLGQATLDATLYAPRKLGMNRMFSTADASSIRSGKAGMDTRSPNRTASNNYLTGWIPGLGSSIFGNDNEELKAVATTTGMKIFMISPFDVIVAVKRTLIDRVRWYEENEQYQKAWELLEEHPEVAASTTEPSEASTPPTPSKASSFVQSDSITSPSRQPPKPTLAEFFADTASLAGSPKPDKGQHSNAEKEKGRIGELWLAQLTKAGNWSEAGEIAGKVLNNSNRWETWAWTFVRNHKFDEISPYLPTLELIPPLPAAIYETVLGHYVSRDRVRFQQLIDQWPSDLFDIGTVINTIHEQIQHNDIKQDSTDWRILNECIAKLYLASGDYKDALHCYIMLQDADTALTLVKDYHLVEALVDDIADFVLLRISQEQITRCSQEELADLSSDSIKLLVDEASLGVINADTVIDQLKSSHLQVFLYFYLANLWHGTGRGEARSIQRHRFSTANLTQDEGRTLVEDHADLAIELFAKYDRDLFNKFLHASTLYDYSKALKIAHDSKFVEEEVYLLSKTGSLKKALYLIIDELQDVSKAIAFAKEQGDKGLWEDLLDYSMSRPQFISGLLAEVGTAIDPITLVKRIPSGIEIEGLKEGLKKMIREYDLQDSISTGVAKVLDSEVGEKQLILRRGRRRGIKFDMPHHRRHKKNQSNTGETEEYFSSQHDQQSAAVNSENNANDISTSTDDDILRPTEPGHCASCHSPFHPDELETLIGFACGHVYHSNHLFPKQPNLPSTTKPDNLGDEDDGYEPGFTRSVAAKVTNARVLRDRIRAGGGCRVCAVRKRLDGDETA